MERRRTAKEAAIRGFLIKNSGLTKTQANAVLSYVRGEHATSNAELRRLSNKRVSKGAFFRSLAQARRNIEAAIYTLTLLAYEEVIGQRYIDNITIVGNLLRELAESPELVETAEIQQVLEKSEALITRAIREMTARRL